jgi:hypothetical protein
VNGARWIIVNIQYHHLQISEPISLHIFTLLRAMCLCCQTGLRNRPMLARRRLYVQPRFEHEPKGRIDYSGVGASVLHHPYVDIGPPRRHPVGHPRANLCWYNSQIPT